MPTQALSWSSTLTGKQNCLVLSKFTLFISFSQILPAHGWIVTLRWRQWISFAHWNGHINPTVLHRNPWKVTSIVDIKCMCFTHQVVLNYLRMTQLWWGICVVASTSRIFFSCIYLFYSWILCVTETFKFIHKAYIYKVIFSNVRDSNFCGKLGTLIYDQPEVFCSERLHLFDEKYSINSNNVKYSYNLKYI